MPTTIPETRPAPLWLPAPDPGLAILVLLPLVALALSIWIGNASRLPSEEYDSAFVAWPAP
jgi:hypothetical protein